MAAIAGYGVGVRLELLMVPVVFSIGQALVVMLGVNVGAGNAVRAKRIAWIGAGPAATITFVIGTTMALLTHAWVGLFSQDPAVMSAGSLYPHVVGPCFASLLAPAWCATSRRRVLAASCCRCSRCSGCPSFGPTGP